MIKEILDLLEAMNKCKEISDEAEQKLINFFKGRSYYDCVSREEMLKYQQYLRGKMSNEENHKLWEFIKDLPPVTPTHGTCKDCKNNRKNPYARKHYTCELGNRCKLRDCDNFYCADFKKRGDLDGSN